MASLGVGLMLVLLSILGAWHTVREKRSVNLERKWAAVPGRVIRSKVHLVGGNFEPLVEYSYSFEGATHTGSRLRSTDVSTESRGPAEADVARYPPGADITVFVNPDMPADSVVEPGTREWYLTGKILSCAFVAWIGFVMIKNALP